MHTVERRIYSTDAEGRRILLYRPGDLISASEAKHIAALEAGEGEAAEKPKPLDRMRVGELKAVCEAEGIDPAGANLRAEYVQTIRAARAAAGNQEQ